MPATMRLSCGREQSCANGGGCIDAINRCKSSGFDVQSECSLIRKLNDFAGGEDVLQRGNAVFGRGPPRSMPGAAGSVLR